MSRQITKRSKPRVSRVPVPPYLRGRHYGTHVWVCHSEALGLRAYSGSAAGAAKLYFKVLPNHIYRQFI